jgi:hypothetical protein
MSNFNKIAILEKAACTSSVYMLWITIHYISAHLYAYLCTPLTISGYLLTPFFVNAPHCQGLRWGLNHGAEAINVLWLILGTWFTTKLVIKPVLKLGGITQKSENN